jgi:hypothetical protein
MAPRPTAPPRTDQHDSAVPKDSAILLSVALQYGADPVALRSALSPTGPLAAVLTHIEG